MNSINTIAFDADDTLWINETYFQEAEMSFCRLLENYMPHESVARELYGTEMRNLHLYGYGVKGFMLCMMETAGRISNGNAPLSIMNKVIDIGHDLLQKPVELLEGVPETLEHLQGKYRLVVATKGDLLDQERKLRKSGLEKYFHHIEIMSDKKKSDYQKLIKHLDCTPESFLMIGNSIKSDILPVLENGGYAAHVPYHITWAHEHHEEKPESEYFMEFKNIREILDYL
ncbi:putative hydrolase of the HAD superfamily [Chryseobacterium taeanense]|uniref:Putative hydrolase of the HAD superfamily n=2 Tax=Chryseobacterium taeanense TaxID=311334 RepID=A0A1G8G028_9FLAO|nr:HAD family hydrolase [Chryseobacterium taeanense]SDH87759.1 putative hydrolase of the HAD superfamily [Chryseobacterium taeanense]